MSEVPAPFRSSAVSIERFRIALVGEPEALRTVAHTWRRKADDLDESWRYLDASRRGFLHAWQGNAARQYDLRADRFSGTTASLATSLRFAGDGLDLAATELIRARRAAEIVIVSFVSRVRALHDHMMMLEPGLRGAAWPAMASAASAAAQQTLSRVHAEQARLDHVLASMWSRFDLTKSAPWRSGIIRATQLSYTGDLGVAANVGKGARVKFFDGQVTGRVAVKPGVTLIRDIHGTYTIQIGLDVRGTGIAKAGRKVDVSTLPSSLSDEVARGYAEAEAGGRVSGVARYHFGDEAAALAFAERIGNLDPSGLRPPDEYALTWGASGKAFAEGGLPTAAGASASTSADAYWSYTGKSDGSTAWTYGTAGQNKIGATEHGETSLLGAGGGSQTRLDYDPAGVPTQYASQQVTLGNYESHAGTNNAPLGIQKEGGGELYYKSYDESAMRTVETRVLDLRNPVNAQFYEASLAGGPAASAHFADQVSGNGTVTLQEYEVRTHMDEISVKSETPVPMIPSGGVKGAVTVEEYALVDSWYINNTRPGGRPFEPVPGPRPLP